MSFEDKEWVYRFPALHFVKSENHKIYFEGSEISLTSKTKDLAKIESSGP